MHKVNFEGAAQFTKLQVCDISPAATMDCLSLVDLPWGAAAGTKGRADESDQTKGQAQARPKLPTRIMRGSSNSKTATPTPTTRPIIFASCGVERDPAGQIKQSGHLLPPLAPFVLHALWHAYRAYHKGKRFLSTRRSGTCLECPKPLFNPCRPTRIVAQTFNQAHPNRVSHHISSSNNEVVVFPQHMLLKAALLNSLTECVQFAIYAHGRIGFEARYQRNQTALSHRHQQMQVIGHQHISQRLAPTRIITSAQPVDGGSCQVEIGKQWLTPKGDCHDQTHSTNARNPSMQHFSGVGHHGEQGQVIRAIRHSNKPLSIVFPRRSVPVGAAQTESSYYVLLHPDPARFVAWRSELETFLHERLNFKPKKLADQRAYFATPHLRMRVGKHWTLAGICPGGQPTEFFVHRPALVSAPNVRCTHHRCYAGRSTLAALATRSPTKAGTSRLTSKHRTLACLWLVQPPAGLFLFRPNPILWRA